MFLLLAARNAACILPHGSGGGGTIRSPQGGGWWKGREPRRFFGDDGDTSSETPLPPPFADFVSCGWSPFPATAGQDDRHRSRDASPRPSFANDHDNTTFLNSPPAHKEGGGAPKGASIHSPRQDERRYRLSPVVAARATQTNVATRLRFGRARLSALRRGSRQRLSPGWLNSRPCFLGRGEACEPEKWKPVFRKDHTQLKTSGRYPPSPVPVQGLHLPHRP